ncbi:MAG: Fe3+/spermidine/putrescine ABC transporter ATP-binding protein [Mesorhizobium sp. 61-13]|nr:ABC transporter ATP-binding protein [Mesorhizobium sp.]OJU52843.1 MAG: Fe3+/spermidine/putrescine ABC transporter ATP-binding protein [Mesorhizobium sp. 61-13]
MPSATINEGPSGKPLLVARALKKFYGGEPAVRGVDFSIEHNSYVTLLGPSGCGKTTILRMIGGFEAVSAGTLELDQRSLVDVSANRRPVNTVFQSYALFPHLTVAENVGFSLSLKGLDRATIQTRVAGALAMVRMEAMSGRWPRQLSGGQQQRVALARAIINEPKLLLLDEPLSALDRKMRKDMQIELKDLQRRLGMTFLHVTHDQEEAFALSDWIIVMNRGVIEQQGSPEDIYRRPASAYVADFIGGANLLSGKIAGVKGELAAIDTEFGTIEAPCTSGLNAGQVASLCLRPEQISLNGNGRAISGAVSHVVFQGAESLIEVEAGKSRLQVRCERTPPEVGSTIKLTFDPQRAWIAAGAMGQGS